MELVLAGLLIAAVAYHAVESRAWTAERSRLLDRIMAKTYNEFVHTTATTAEASAAISDEAWHKQNYIDHPELYPDGPDVAE